MRKSLHRSMSFNTGKRVSFYDVSPGQSDSFAVNDKHQSLPQLSSMSGAKSIYPQHSPSWAPQDNQASQPVASSYPMGRPLAHHTSGFEFLSGAAAGGKLQPGGQSSSHQHINPYHRSTPTSQTSNHSSNGLTLSPQSPEG